MAIFMPRTLIIFALFLLLRTPFTFAAGRNIRPSSPTPPGLPMSTMGPRPISVTPISGARTTLPDTSTRGQDPLLIANHSATQATSPLERDPKTNLFGVDDRQLGIIISMLKTHYGDALLDLAAIGSRATGRASSLKSHRPVRPQSDLDLIPLLRRSPNLPDSQRLAKQIELATGIPIEIHGVLSDGETTFADSVPFYGGGGEDRHFFHLGEALRISLERS